MDSPPTEQLARRAGPAVGGLLNVSFGNTAELVLALFVLAAGKADVVKAQISGSIIGNSLLGLGLAIVAGSVGRDKQTFKRARAGQLSSLLVLSMIALLLPALFDYVVRGSPAGGRLSRDEHFSLSVSVVLIVVYVANLVYTLITHRDVFAFGQRENEDISDGAGASTSWSVSKGLLVLAGGTAATALQAHFISGALEHQTMVVAHATSRSSMRRSLRGLDCCESVAGFNRRVDRRSCRIHPPQHQRMPLGAGFKEDGVERFTERPQAASR